MISSFWIGPKESADDNGSLNRLPLAQNNGYIWVFSSHPFPFSPVLQTPSSILGYPIHNPFHTPSLQIVHARYRQNDTETNEQNQKRIEKTSIFQRRDNNVAK